MRELFELCQGARDGINPQKGFAVNFKRIFKENFGLKVTCSSGQEKLLKYSIPLRWPLVDLDCTTASDQNSWSGAVWEIWSGSLYLLHPFVRARQQGSGLPVPPKGRKEGRPGVNENLVSSLESLFCAAFPPSDVFILLPLLIMFHPDAVSHLFSQRGFFLWVFPPV
jgi:hypothetical protein